MKKNYYNYFLIICILAFAIFIRLQNLDKIPGLWYDEIVIYSIAAKKSILLSLHEDGHRFLLFPLYYLIYKAWITVFGNSDYVIRLMSVFFDILSVISAYFVGVSFATLINKDEVKNKIGMFNMLFYSINSSFIYYAQEAKFYSLTFFLINILIICWTKFLKNPNKKNIILFLIANGLLLYTYTAQILLIIAVQIVTLSYFLLYKKEEIKKYVNQFLGLLVILVPLFILIFRDHQYFSGNFDSVIFDNSFIFLVLQNYFTPILVGVQNNALSYQYVLLVHIFNLKWWLYIYFPMIFSIVLLIKGSIKEHFSKIFIAVAIIYIGCHVLMVHTSNYAPLVRYVLMAIPFLIVVMSNGLEVLCRKKSGYVLLALLLAVNLLAFNSSFSPTKIKRPPSYKELADELISEYVNPDSNFILPIRISLLEKYYHIKGNKYSLYYLNSEDCQKTYLTAAELNEIKRKNNMYENYKRFLASSDISKSFEDFVMKNYAGDTKKDLVVIDDSDICMFTDESISQILSKNDDVYRKYPIQFLRLSKLENNLIKVLSKNMRLKKTFSTDKWQVYVFSAK